MSVVQLEQAEVYRVTLVRIQRGVLYKWSRQKCTGWHWYAHREGVVLLEQAEVYRLDWYAHTEGFCTSGAGGSVQATLVRTHRGMRYKWSKQKWSKQKVTLLRTHRGMLYKWSRQKCTGLVHGHGGSEERRRNGQGARWRVVRHLEIVSCFSDWTKLGSLTNRDPRRVKSALWPVKTDSVVRLECSACKPCGKMVTLYL